MTTQNNTLPAYLQKFAGLTGADIAESLPFWKTRKMSKGDFFNMQRMVCNDLGFVIKGIFRIYYRDEHSGEEKNVFFFTEEQFVVSFRSFIGRFPCHYFIEAMEDSEVVFITHQDLTGLYEKNLNWGRFGRLLGEFFFQQSQTRMEELLFYSHEQRYLRLLEKHPNIIERIPAYHISSFLGITNPSLSRIRKRLKS